MALTPEVSFTSSSNTGIQSSTKNEDDKYTHSLTISNSAKMAGDVNSRKVTMVATYKNSGGTKTCSHEFTLNDPEYIYELDANGGILTTSTSVKKQYGSAFGPIPTPSKNGFAFVGFFESKFDDSFDEAKYSGSMLAETTPVESDKKWYAAWQANKYNLTFSYKDSSYKDTSEATSVYYTQTISTPDVPQTVNDGVDYTYTFTGWNPTVPSTMPANDATYTATYSKETHYATLTELIAQIGNAEAKMNESLYTQGAYTAETVSALESAYNAAKTLRESSPLKSQQSAVDLATENLQKAIANLQIKKFIVVFADDSGAILKNGYWYVSYGDKVAAPTNPEKESDHEKHYKFSGWDSTDSDDLSACNYVTDDLKYVAKFTAEDHDFTSTPINSTCTTDGATKYTCSCGYSYTEANTADKAHHNFAETTIKEATCSENGIKANVCSVCGVCEKDSITSIPKTTHTYGSWTVYTAPTCAGEGVSYRECACGAREYKTTNKTSHSFSGKTVVAPTCTTKGYSVHSCSMCGLIEIFDETPATGHSDNTTTVNPTCVSAGYTETKCSTCGHTTIAWSDATGKHSYPDTWTTVSEATCGNMGIEERECSVCKKVEYKIIPKLTTHSYDSGVETVPATCTADGIKTYTCSVCGDHKNEPIASFGGHDLQKDTVNSTEANCTQPGVEIEKCSRCDYSETTVTPATGHNYTNTTHDATCGNAGYIEHKCACGYEYNEYTTPATGNHEWTFSQATDKGVTTLTGTCENCDATFSKEVSSDHSFTVVKTYTPATCSAKGSIVIGCSDTGCPAEVSVELSEDADAHKSFTTAITNPKCTENGKAVTTCDDCGEAVATENIPAKGHTFTTKSSETKGDCRNAGKVVLKCADCDETKTVLLSVDKNAHVYELTSSAAATCDSAAYDVYTCKVCNDSTYKQFKGEALGHLWGEATVEQDDTVVTITRTCTRTDCGATDVQTVSVFAGHNFARLENVTDATCKNTGLMKLYCTDDGCDEYIDITVPVNAAAHTLTTDTKAPDCDNDGYVKTYCSECNEPVSNVTINKLGHDFFTNLDSATATTPATCTTAGTKSVKCSRCDATADVTIPKLGHSYEKVTGGKTPTCSEYGWDVYECQNDGCDESYNSLLDKLGHDFDEDLTVVTNPTCTERGYTTKHCKTCDEDVVMDYTDPTDHDFIPTVTPPTCLEKGYTTHTCQNTGCGYYYVDTYTDALGHDFDNEGTVIYDGNCAEQKVIKHTCNHDGCDETWNEYVGEIGSHDYQFAETVAPKCLEGGYDLYKCSLCGSEKKENFTKALGHDWDYWEITKYPSETADGQKVNGSQKHVCKRCGAVETEEIIEGKYYLVTFYNYDGTRLIRPAYYSYGKAAKMPDFTPTRVADTGYTYTFKGYNFSQAEIDCVTKRMAVIAEYDAHERSYAVTYRNEDGTVLQTVSSVKYSKITDAYTAGTPTKASDEYYTYTFNSWSVNCDPESGTAVATATYTQKLTDENVTPDGNKPGIFTKFIAWLKTLLKKLFGIEL